MTDQLKTRKASDFYNGQGIIGSSSVDLLSSAPSPKKLQHEPSRLMFLRFLNSALILKSRGHDDRLFDEVLSGDMSELDEAIEYGIASHHDFWRSIGYSLLENAVKAELISVVKLLLKYTNGFNISVKASDLLFFACRQGYLEIAEVLLVHGADVNKWSTAIDGGNETCLSFACMEGNLDVAKFLLSHGADPNFACPDGSPPLVRASGYGNIDIVKFLLENGADPNLHNSYNEAPLACACSDGYADIAKLLLDYGADINAHNSEGDTPLMAAFDRSRPDKDLIQLLLDRGADPSIANTHGKTALDCVAEGSEYAQMMANAQLEHILK